MSNTIAGLTLYGAEDIGDDYGRFLLHGSQGSGKTFLGSTIAALGKTLLVDMRGERGSRSWLGTRSEEHTSELQSLMRISYAVFCLKKKKQQNNDKRGKQTSSTRNTNVDTMHE